MPRSVKIHPDRKQQVISAITRNGFLTQGDLSANLGIALCTLNKFINSKPVYISRFEEICEALGLDKRELTKPVNQNSDNSLQQSAIPQDFYAYDDGWVGREQLVAELSGKLRGSCRLLLLLGLTGIGKTALAEKLAVELQGWLQEDLKNNLQRANFDYQDKATDFTSVAAKWLEEWGERLSPEDKKPEILLHRLVNHLCRNQILILLDSLERLLTGNEEDGWGNFADEWWKKFFLSLLSAESCKSRLIITSQDLPVELIDSRYKNFWHQQIIYGLTEEEQVALFEKLGLDVSEESPSRPLLLRLGKAYKGHPLVLRVIIGEIINEPFNGDVQAYWHNERENTRQKIEEVEKSLAEAEQGKTLGEKDEWQTA